MKSILLGIDLGTSACKVTAFAENGDVICAVNEGYPLETPKPGWVEQHPDCWWAAVCRACRDIASHVDSTAIAGIGIDGQSWAAVMLDDAGQVLAPCPIWMDTRAASLCEDLKARWGEKLFNISGNPLSPSYTLPKVLYWMQHEPALMQRAASVLQSNSFIVYRLTEVLSQDVSQGYGWQIFDQQKLDWDKTMASALGIPDYLLPPIVPCHQVVGTVTAEASRQCGLPEGIPVVAGGLDAACGTLGGGVIRPGQTQEQGGQAGGMSICLDHPASHPQLILSAHVVPGRWLLQGGTVGGGGALNWFARELGGYEALQKETLGQSVFEQFSDEAAAVSPGSDGLIFLPYMAGERSPLWDPAACGVFFGLGYDKSRAHMIRAVMEGTAFALRHNLETAVHAGAEVSEMITVGGAGNSRTWTQIKADITGKIIHVARSDTATTLGAAMLAGVGVGVYRDFDDAAARLVVLTRTHTPDQSHRLYYERNYTLYRQLYPVLKPYMTTMAQWKERV